MSNENIEWLELMREASYVQRLHTVNTINTQNLGHHSFNVAMLVMVLTDNDPSMALLRAALFHDMHEVHLGDIPSPTKADSRYIRDGCDVFEAAFNHNNKLHTQLSEYEERVLKWADTLELMYFCLEEMTMGNRNARVIFERAQFYANQMGHVRNSETILQQLGEKSNALR